jgi:hypothetical protein
MKLILRLAQIQGNGLNEGMYSNYEGGEGEPDRSSKKNISPMVSRNTVHLTIRHANSDPRKLFVSPQPDMILAEF